MKILITGSTGFIGSHLVENLISEDYELRILVRNKVDVLKSKNIELFFGDLTKRETIRQIAKDIDVVYHIAGILGGASSKKTIWDVNVNGTKNLLDVCEKESVKKFTYCSSAGVLGSIKDPPASESHPYNPSNIYEKSKMIAEKLVLKSSLPTVVIRPEFVYGPRDMHALGLFRIVKKGFFPLLGNRKTFLHPTYVGDVVKVFEKLLNKKIRNEVFIIAGERYITVEEFVDIIAEELNIKIKKVKIPLFFAKFSSYISEYLKESFKIPMPFTRSTVSFFCENHAFDISKARKRLDYKPIKLEDGIKITIKWYTENGFL